MKELIDLVGKMYGRWRVLHEVIVPNKSRRWMCECSCKKKTQRIVIMGDLRAGKSISCGCYRAECLSKRNTIDLTDQVFTNLTVLHREDRPNRKGHVLWKCECKCGNTSVVTGYALTHGVIRSCGCMRSEERNTCGLSDHRIYRIWSGMIRRCYNVKHKQYIDYGGRGIFVCDEWRTNFKAFYDWSLHNGYAEDLQIDRIDNDGGYSIDNSRWTTDFINNHNKRTLGKTNTSGYSGVSKKGNGWSVSITVRYKKHYLGVYTTKAEAVIVKIITLLSIIYKIYTQYKR